VPAPVPSYTCLTSDLVASKQEPERARTQRRLEKVLEAANEAFAAVLAVPLSIILGDEWQGLVHTTADALRIDFFVRRGLHPARVRSGIGRGEVSTALRDRTSLMDGPCFHRSREAITLAKKRSGSATMLSTGQQAIDDLLNTTGELLYAVFDDWTDKQFASVMAFLDQETETKAAKSLGVAQPTLHKSVHGAHGKEFLNAIRAREAFLELHVDGVGRRESEAP
jgi:hypothetical protein